MSLRARLGVRRDGFRLEAELEARAGETVVLIGPNGAGKSTLVEALAGLVPLASGRVELDGRVLEDPEAGIRLLPQERQVGLMFQDLGLFPSQSVRDNVAYGLVARGLSRRAARARADIWLERLGLAHIARRRPQQLSGGEAQRTALARALAAEPRLLLLDEPLSAFDMERRPQTRALLRALLEEYGGVRLVITHDPLEALLLADRLVILEGGRVVQTGTPDEARQRPLSAYVASLVGVNLVAGVLREDAGRHVLDCGKGSLVVARAEVPAGAPALARVHPRAIVVSTQRPESSARNALAGPIEALDLHGDLVRLRLGTSPPLIAEVTPEAVRALGLSVGKAVYASLKATEIDVYPS
jgi:molybdate transport system ATP-binding protein